MTLRFVPGEPVHYRADLSPHDTAVLRPVDRPAGQRGERPGGRGRQRADADRRPRLGGRRRGPRRLDDGLPRPRLAFCGSRSRRLRVNPRLMPASWRVPALSGPDRRQGRHGVDAARRLAGRHPWPRAGDAQTFPFLRPITLYLESDGRGFRFGLGRDRLLPA